MNVGRKNRIAKKKEGKRKMRRKDQKIRKTVCMLDKTDGTVVIFFC
jgi:hypothetical protein